ncbi:MAG: transcription antitermination factor NusB [Gemmatimonadaceae bacterium]|nr:transcription antitermination factor NusB [Gemmatimonadaceae bacterium]
MSRTRVETRARARALQALYAWDMRGEESTGAAALVAVADRIWDDLHVAPDERERAVALVQTVSAERAGIDRALRDVTTNWRLERLGAIERCVLRLGAAELLRGDTPPRVVIQEGVRLAERYGSEQSARFVNGVLDALARRMGRL